jgi:hypothetical protein
MLGDNPEKSKNPLKKAMRRRNAKTVQFAPPTYYEPSDYEYSDEEDESDDMQPEQQSAENADENDSVEDQQQSQVTPNEPQEARNVATVNGIQRVTSNESLKNEATAGPSAAHSVVLDQKPAEDPVQRSRKGVVRNTDSFFKDDTVETKKISLTPRLLRGDSDSGGSAEPDVRQRPSLETFDKIVGADDKSKDKKKEKKGMLSGLFKRKKGGASEEPEKATDDARQSPGSKDSTESLAAKGEQGPERKPSKLQKTPPLISPKSSPTEPRYPQQQQPLSQTIPAPTAAAPEPPVARKGEEVKEGEPAQQSAPVQVNRFPSLTEKRSIFAPISTALRSTPADPDSGSPVKPVYSKRAKERFAIDESDSEADEKKVDVEEQDRKAAGSAADLQPPIQRSDSAVQVSPMQAPAPTGYRSQVQAPATLSSSPLPHDTLPPESEGTASTSKPSPSTATHTPSTSRSTPTWSDASLRTYMENSQDIKDLLIIVHDKSNVNPVGPDHPLMHNLFHDERTKLAEMQSQLDTMLMSWMSKKNSALMTTAT